MKRFVLFTALAGIALLLAPVPAFPVAYEASTLHNAVARSETVQDLFFERWDKIQEKELYFDWYGKLNWVNDFKINTVNAGSGAKETVPMTLVRAYGSLTLNYPILGGYEGKDMSERLSGKAKKEKEDEEKGSGPMGLWKPNNLIVGLTMTGFHYGLTRKAEIDRGAAGNESVTDYKYAQFFDDIFAASLLYRPYFFIHAGVIINNQIEPNDDGTMDYTNSTDHSLRYFVASNLLSFLNLNATTTKDKLEAIAVGVKVNSLVGSFVKISPYVPVFTVTFKRLNLYNDEPFDAVWVKSAAGKSSVMDDSLKEQAALDTLSFLLTENLFGHIFLSGYVELQRPTEKLISKRTNEEVAFALMREWYASIGYNFLGKRADREGRDLILAVGVSSLWDVAIPVHRERGSGYDLMGGFASLNFSSPVVGAEIKGAYNYAPELRKLVEIADKFMIEGSFYVSF
ncbi:MAG: hypothetical protein EPN93_13795 [Spirochaetes bacterium]|nr:MAG: hypothetical protein EPN93_13795 [Spirochaetota bacterium]